MKNIILYSFLLMIMLHGIPAQGTITGSGQNNDPATQFKQRKYSLSNDKVRAVLKVIQYSKAIIQYEINVVTAKGKIEQKGYALNLSSEINQGIEGETDDNHKEIWVVPYQTYLCSCGNQVSLEIRISTDANKSSVYASEKLRSSLFDDNSSGNRNPADSVQLMGYLYLEDR